MLWGAANSLIFAFWRAVKITTMENLTIELQKRTTEEYHSFMGGDDSNPTWQEYIDGYKDEYKPHVLLIKKCIEENGLLRETGEGMQRLGVTFKFSDGQHWGFSWRAWGDLMQAIINKQEGYMEYYM